MRIIKSGLMAIVITLAFAACNQGKIEQLTSENADLAAQHQQLNAEIEDYLRTFSEIESNLAEIKERESMIEIKTSDSPGGAEDKRASVLEDIQAINGLLEQNKLKIAELTDRLGESDSRYKKLLASMNSRMKEKEEEIAVLKTDLEKLNYEREELTGHVVQLTETVNELNTKTELQGDLISTQQSRIDDQVLAMNTAYVAVGTSRDLRDENVISSDGGLLGIGKVPRLKEDFNDGAFQRIDIREVREIPINTKKCEIVTRHPAGSFELSRSADDSGIEKIVITDPDTFWNTSKYLVVRLN